MGTRTYIGDGVFVHYDGYALVLTTENGFAATNTIVMEPAVWEALVRYVNHLEDYDPPPEEVDGFTVGG